MGLYRRLGHCERIGDLGIGHALQPQTAGCPPVPVTSRAKMPMGGELRCDRPPAPDHPGHAGRPVIHQTSFEVIARYVEALGGRLDLVAD